MICKLLFCDLLYLQSIGNIAAQEGIIVGVFELLERHSHFDPRMACSHPEELGCQLLYLVTENDRHSLLLWVYLVFISTGTTPLCWYPVISADSLSSTSL